MVIRPTSTVMVLREVSKMSIRKGRLVQLAALGAVLLGLSACAGAGSAKIQATAPPASPDKTETPLTIPHNAETAPATPDKTDTPPAAPVKTDTPLALPDKTNTPLAAPDKSSFQKAAPLASNTWLNSPPITLEALRGKVVVVDFWTFACINCQHVLPYLKAWDQKYRAQGLVIIGVHTPELSFERDVANVKQAIKDNAIRYPIAIDGDYANWNRYHVWAWPTWFIVDKEGYIRYSHVGEGDYSGSEAMIRQLLAE